MPRARLTAHERDADKPLTSGQAAG